MEKDLKSHLERLCLEYYDEFVLYAFSFSENISESQAIVTQIFLELQTQQEAQQGHIDKVTIQTLIRKKLLNE